MKTNTETFRKIFYVALVNTLLITVCYSQDVEYYLKDRGTGIATSMFGTYINEGEIILYPFFEYYYDKNAEYEPFEFGYGLEEDFRGKYTASEALFYIGYGISEWVMVEFEAAFIDATQWKAGNDPSNMPEKLNESGLGDVEGQIRWRYFREAEKMPEVFSYFETVFPFQQDKELIGTQDWEFKFGSGVIKGYNWGTMTLRAALEYNSGENKVELGEYAIEYLKRVSDFFRFYVGMEGAQDEVEMIADLQFHFKPWMFFRVNNAFGITSKATDFAPEIGLLFYLNKMQE